MADTFKKTLKKGDRGRDVRLAQEWLCFHGSATGVDGIFGPATELATKDFQTKRSIAATGTVNAATQKAMLSPIEAVQQPIAAGSKPLAQLYVAYALQHLKEHPIEIGGQNSGPWVRLYMNGNEGRAWPWCAGFATWVLRQAARTLGVAAPHPYAFGCDFLAAKGQTSNTFLSVNKAVDFPKVKPGYLFLVRNRNAQNDWVHTGIVESIQGEAMTTIEGNTDEQGGSDGFEVCRRTRALAGKDYLVV